MEPPSATQTHKIPDEERDLALIRFLPASEAPDGPAWFAFPPRPSVLEAELRDGLQLVAHATAPLGLVFLLNLAHHGLVVGDLAPTAPFRVV